MKEFAYEVPLILIALSVSLRLSEHPVYHLG